MYVRVCVRVCVCACVCACVCVCTPPPHAHTQWGATEKAEKKKVMRGEFRREGQKKKKPLIPPCTPPRSLALSLLLPRPIQMGPCLSAPATG